MVENKPRKQMKNNENDYVIRVLDSPLALPGADWKRCWLRKAPAKA
jgi:hypothetical protein